jgi:hypothetical protein
MLQTYEAIGLPITELIPSYFDILVRMLYNTLDWNLTFIEARLLDDTKSSIRPRVDRNLVREAYWMEYANSETGVRLNWNSYEYGQNGLTLEQTELLLSMNG